MLSPRPLPHFASESRSRLRLPTFYAGIVLSRRPRLHFASESRSRLGSSNILLCGRAAPAAAAATAEAAATAAEAEAEADDG